MEIAKNVYQCHIENEKNAQVMHPGGSNVYFIGDPNEEMFLVDTGEHSRRWTKTILDYYEQLGKPKITSILITHGHGDHTGGIERLQEIMQCPVMCHPKLVKGLKPFIAMPAATPVILASEIPQLTNLSGFSDLKSSNNLFPMSPTKSAQSLFFFDNSKIALEKAFLILYVTLF